MDKELTLESAQDRIKYLESENDTLKKFVTTLNEAKVSNEETIAKYEELFKPEELPLLEKALSALEAYKNLGTVEEVSELVKENAAYKEYGTLKELEEGVSILESISELGTVGSIKKAMDENAEYKEFGTLKELEKCASVLESVAELGTVEQLERAVTVLESYVDLGTFEEVSEKVKLANTASDMGYTVESLIAAKEEKEAAEHKAVIESLCDKYFIEADLAEATLKLNNGSVEATHEYLNMLRPHRAKASEKKDSLLGLKVESVVKGTTDDSKKEKKRITFLNSIR